jgi:predicted acetyltransferase
MTADGLQMERLNRSIHETEYLEFAAEFRDQDEGGFDRLEMLFSDTDEYFGLVERFEHDEELPNHWVNMSHFVFFAGPQLVGTSRFRHRLSAVLELDGGHIGYHVCPSLRGRGYATEILRQTLKEAGLMGIPKALLTVATPNAPSIRVVEKNGGLFDREVRSPRSGEIMRRYWLDTEREISS